MTTRMMLGVDPSIATTGWSIVADDAPKGGRSRFRLVAHGTIKTDPKDRDYTRLGIIYDNIFELDDEHMNAVKCPEAVVESANRWTRDGKNVGSLQDLAMSFGAILAALHCRGYSVTTRPAMPAKQGGLATKGKAKDRLRLFFDDPPKMNTHETDATLLSIWGLTQPRKEQP